jgi:RNA polymerase sigma factor (TIGR02999 family)
MHTVTPDVPAQALTASLRQWMSGDHSGEATLLATIYPLLRAIAQRQLSVNGRITLQATELAHEAFLRLRERSQLAVEDRKHFLAFAARVMRNLIIDHLRERSASKRGGEVLIVGMEQIGDLPTGGVDPLINWLAIDHALRGLERESMEHARLAEMRYFLGLSVEQCAEELGVSAPTVHRMWRFARAWLAAHLGEHKSAVRAPDRSDP